MLQLGSGMQTIEGVTVFPDHADENQFWYLPAHLEIARRPADDWPQFSFIKYKRSASNGGVEGGGFLMFTVSLTLPQDVERRVRAAIPATAKLTAVPVDSGTVECVALNLQGPGGTTAVVSDAGTFIAVQEILGARVPSLFGENNAVFSLTLSAEGATLLESAFAQGAAPIGVIYTLTFTAMQPSLDVRITADFARIYEHFSAGLSANIYYVELAIQAGLETLVQDGAIKIEVTNYSTSADREAQEKEALDFFTQNLLQMWFTPTLTPGTLQGGMATAPRATGRPVSGPGSGNGNTRESSSGSTNRLEEPSGRSRPPEPANPPAPRRDGASPPEPPRPAGGGTNPPTPPAGSGGGSGGGTSPSSNQNTPTPPTPERADSPAVPAAPEVPDTPDAPIPPATPEATARDVVVNFVEEGGTDGVNGVFVVGYQAESTWQDTLTTPGSSSQMHTAFPGTWTGWVSVDIRSLPVLTIADADQLRQYAITGTRILASGQRPTESNLAMDEIDLPASSPLSLTVHIPVTKITVAATSPDALVAAVFPDGQLVQAGIYDCRRISGTNNFELIIPGWPGSFASPIGGTP